MPVITQTIQPDERRSEVTAIQQALISLGASIDPGELATANVAGTYGLDTQQAMGHFRQHFGHTLTGGFDLPDFNAADGRLLNIAVAAESGNSAALQKAVRESFAVIHIPRAAEETELRWLARYATIAGDFATASKILDLLPNGLPLVAAIVKQSTLQPPKPELLNPENYYTFLYDNVPKNTVKFLLRGLKSKQG